MGRQYTQPGHPPPPRPRTPAYWITRGLQALLLLGCLWFTIFSIVPIFISAKVTGDKLRSVSRFKEIGIAVNLYLADHHDRFPPASRWQDLSEPYAKDPKDFELGPDLRGANFAFNRALDSVSSLTIDQPSQTPLVFESSLMGRNAAGGPRDVTAADGSFFTFTTVDTSTKRTRIENASDRPWTQRVRE